MREYYVIDPDKRGFFVWSHNGATLAEIEGVDDWTSPLLGFRIRRGETDVELFHSDGSPFESFQELMNRAAEAMARADAEAERAQQATERADAAEARAAALEARLRALGVELEG